MVASDSPFSSEIPLLGDEIGPNSSATTITAAVGVPQIAISVIKPGLIGFIRRGNLCFYKKYTKFFAKWKQRPFGQPEQSFLATVPMQPCLLWLSELRDPVDGEEHVHLALGPAQFTSVDVDIANRRLGKPTVNAE